MSTGLERIRELVREKPDRKLQTLMHLVNTESLRAMHEKQKTGKAPGVDRVTKSEYEEKLEENLANLIGRMKTFSYRPQPVRRTYIPKEGGKKKLKSKRQAVKTWLRENMHLPITLLIKKLNLKLNGHYNYYGVSGNSKKIVDFYQYVKWQLLRTLQRRSQRDKTNWDALNKIFKYNPIAMPTLRVDLRNL